MKKAGNKKKLSKQDIGTPNNLKYVSNNPILNPEQRRSDASTVHTQPATGRLRQVSKPIAILNPEYGRFDTGLPRPLPSKQIDQEANSAVPSPPQPTKNPAQPQSRRSPRTLRTPPSRGPPRIEQKREDKKKTANNDDIDETENELANSVIGMTENEIQNKKTREPSSHSRQKQGVLEARTKPFEKIEKFPLEIRCRGPEAEKAYREALKNGEVEVYRGQIMLIGQDRAGKTSLKKSLLGLSFDPNEQSTDGVVVDPSSFSVDVDDAVDWQISKIPDVNNKYENGLAGVMFELLNQQRSNDIDQSFSEIPENTENTPRKDVVPETVMENLIQRLSAKNLGSTAGQETSVSIWDFAGQQLYYASHPVFFTHRAVYVLVYTLEKDLVAKAEPCVRQGVHEIRLENHDQQTNLETLLSWLVSIHSARPEASDGGKIRKQLPYLRPPVIIVGTHADCPFEEPKKIEEIIQKSITRQSYNQHVVRPSITVDNTMSSNDDGVKKLKEKVKELFSMEPYMGERVPVRWFKFEQVIKSLVEEDGKYYLSLKDLERLILEVCEIEDKKEFSTLLNFYHDLGVIVKHGNTVVLKAEWLIDLFRKLITIRPFNDQNPVNSGYWTTLEETGILDMKLVEHVFKEKIECGETKDDILAMMENYGLIARFGGNEDPKSFDYFVPSQLKSSPEAFCDVGPSISDPCTLYLHFIDGFIPHGLYNLLVSRLITWCSKKDYPHKPNLYQSVSRFFIGRAYRYDLFLIRRKRFVKVVLRSLEAERSWVFQPVAFQIREFLESSLKEITEECLWYQSLNYKICVHCPSRHVIKCEGHQLESCIDDDCLHLLPVEKDRELVCRESFGEESKPCVLGLEEWYREHPIIPVHKEEECIVSLSGLCSSETVNRPIRRTSTSEAASCKDLEVCFGDKSIATVDSKEAASKVADLLKLDKVSMDDPPDDIVVKCRELCSYLKSNGRDDIVKQIRVLLPSGMTGPLGDGSLLVKYMDFNSKQRISRALSAKEEWKAFAEKVGVSKDDIAYYDQRVENPVLSILNDHCGDMTLEELYVHIVESGANAIADNHL